MICCVCVVCAFLFIVLNFYFFIRAGDFNFQFLSLEKEIFSQCFFLCSKSISRMLYV